jgi:hypothetical protein
MPTTFVQNRSCLCGATRCYASIGNFERAATIVGLGVNIPGSKPKAGFSTEIILLRKEGNDWPPEILEQSRYCRNELGFFKSPKISHYSDDEYPL